MQDFDKALEIVSQDAVQDGLKLPQLQLHKWLVLGQSEYLCEYGTLSDGHEKLTDAQRYAQAIKERYNLAVSIKGQEIVAKRAQADIIDAKAGMECARTVQSKLRAECTLEEAQLRLATALVNMQDQLRMLNTYYRIEKELEKSVQSRYPKGIEQAEEDNWKAVAHYRMKKEQVPGMARERLDNVPLSPVEKAKIGLQYERMDALAPLVTVYPQEAKLLMESQLPKELVSNK